MKIQIKEFPEYFLYPDGRIYDSKEDRFLIPTKKSSGLQFRLRNGRKTQSGLSQYSARIGHRLVASALYDLSDQTRVIAFKDGDSHNISFDNVLFVKKKYTQDHKSYVNFNRNKKTNTSEGDTSWMGTGVQF